jgi:hypothetical protein
VVEFYLKLKLILRIISYLTYICWELDNFVIKSDIFRRFFICKNILKKLSCYHDNYFRYFMFGKYNGFVSKAWVSATELYYITGGPARHQQVKPNIWRILRHCHDNTSEIFMVTATDQRDPKLPTMSLTPLVFAQKY